MKSFLAVAILIAALLPPHETFAKSPSGNNAQKRVPAKLPNPKFIIHPSGTCVLTEADTSLPTIFEQNPKCELGKKGEMLPGLTVADCRKSELGVRLMYAETEESCKRAVRQARAAGAM